VISESSRAAPRYLSDLFRNGTAAGLGDAELLSRFAARRSEHDEAAELAFAALLARHGPMVWRVCRAVLGDRPEVEDAFQATFLVLAVRARSIRRRGSVASWLHGVALRVAGSERSRAARRRRYERVRAARTSSTTQDAGSDPVCDHEQSLVIQEEIDRLPEKYQAAVVLCYLEGLTHEMAAERLGWPVGSVKSRLAWARDRLRARLTRRGLAPTNLPFDRSQSASSRDAEPAPLPVLLGTPLAEATLRGALKAGMGRGALVGIVSAEAVALMEGVIRSMTNARLMVMATVAVIAGLVTAGAGVMGYSAIRPENPPRAGSPGQETRPPVAAAPVPQGPLRPAATKPATDQGSLTMQVEVADPQGRRLAGAEVAVTVWYARNSGSLEPAFEQIRTDGTGQARLEVARERSGAWAHSANIWAYQPGRALAVTPVSFARRRASPFVIPLTLDQPAKWSITVLGPEDWPVAGLHLTLDLLRRTDRFRTMPAIPPDAWREPLTATTDTHGVATLTYLPETMIPVSVRVAGPGVAPHTLPLDVPQGKNAILKVGRSGRVVGIVRTAAGVPLANVPVELWVQGADIRRRDFAGPGDPRGDQRITPDQILPLGPQPLKTGSQGTFQTPSTLLSGSTYRVSIRQEGFVPFVSDWVTLQGERAVIPPIRLQPIQKLTGQIQDRQGRAVAGARVFLPAGGPTTTTDAQGRFVLAGINPGKAVILVEQTGFRLQGWLVDPLSQAEVGSLTLVRTSEAPGPVMKPLADPIPPEESRALAERLLEPYLQGPIENVRDELRLTAIFVLSEFDLGRALELFQDGRFRDENLPYQVIQESLGAKLAVKDPARAEALVESIVDPTTKVRALTRMAKVLPASERTRKQALLERATTLLRDRLQQAHDLTRLQSAAVIAEQWLDMGERDRARLVLQAETISTIVFQTRFLGQLARFEPDQIPARLRQLPTLGVDPRNRDVALVEVAFQLAIDHPAEAEQVFNLREGGQNELYSVQDTLRLCRRLAQVDPPRARRIVASLVSPAIRACAWAYMGLGLAKKDEAGAAEAIDRTIQELDRLRESAPGPEPGGGGFLHLYWTNPAVVLLPVVERVAPERLAEVFWRAVALHTPIKTDRADQLQRSNIGFECTLLAQYDRQVAAAILQPIISYLRSLAARTAPPAEWDPSVIAALGYIDPGSAVALIESVTPPRDSRRSDSTHQARLRLAEVLALPRDNRWMRLVQPDD
jgi:RNA polymerase sigma-70 factor (ECF subfamily)